MTSGDEYLVWQLVDSAFPSGGFAHSNGLEAAWQHGQIRAPGALRDWLRVALRQAGRASLPFVLAAARAGGVDGFEAVDRQCETFVLNHVANRGSRAQGQALLATAGRVFPHSQFTDLRRAVRERRLPAHLAPVFGAVAAALGIEPGRIGRLYLFTTLRGAMSAAVRLGIVGPLESQRLQFDLYPDVERTFDVCATLTPADAAQTSPLMELVHGTHDRLYSKLFVS